MTHFWRRLIFLFCCTGALSAPALEPTKELARFTVEAASDNAQAVLLMMLFATYENVRHTLAIEGDNSPLTAAKISRLSSSAAIGVLNDPALWMGLLGSLGTGYVTAIPARQMVGYLMPARFAETFLVEFLETATPGLFMAGGWTLFRQLWSEARAQLATPEEFMRAKLAWVLIEPLFQPHGQRTEQEQQDLALLSKMMTTMSRILLDDPALRRQWLGNAIETRGAMNDLASAVIGLSATSLLALRLAPHVSRFGTYLVGGFGGTVAIAASWMMAKSVQGRYFAVRRHFLNRKLQDLHQAVAQAVRDDRESELLLLFERAKQVRESLASIQIKMLYTLNNALEDQMIHSRRRPGDARSFFKAREGTWQIARIMHVALTMYDQEKQNLLALNPPPGLNKLIQCEINHISQVRAQMKENILPLYLSVLIKKDQSTWNGEWRRAQLNIRGLFEDKLLLESGLPNLQKCLGMGVN